MARYTEIRSGFRLRIPVRQVPRLLCPYVDGVIDIDKIIDAIDRIREPLDRKGNEEQIIRAGYEHSCLWDYNFKADQRRIQKAGFSEYLASLSRTTQALSELNYSNLRSNQQAIAELKFLLKTGQQQLETVFRNLLKEDARPIEPLHHITKRKYFSSHHALGSKTSQRLPSRKFLKTRYPSSDLSMVKSQPRQLNCRKPTRARHRPSKPMPKFEALTSQALCKT